MRHIIAVMLENNVGALARITGLFAQRGYNIESLTVAPTDDARLSRITVFTEGDDDRISQITRQLDKLIDVMEVANLTQDRHVERELLLVRLRSGNENAQTQLRVLIEGFSGQVAQADEVAGIVQLAGSYEDINRFIAKLGHLDVEIVRSGVLGISCERAMLAS